MHSLSNLPWWLFKHHSITQNPPKNSHCFLYQTCNCHLQMVSLIFHQAPTGNASPIFSMSPIADSLRPCISCWASTMGQIPFSVSFPFFPKSKLKSPLQFWQLALRWSPGSPASWYSHFCSTLPLTSYQDWSMGPT